MLRWELRGVAVSTDELGWVPMLVSADDPRPAKEQIHESNADAGGWVPFHGFRMFANGNLQYPADPEIQLIAQAKLRDETLRFYQYDWIAILQSDGSFEIARVESAL